MKKVLFVATVTRHIKSFHIPYLKWFKENGYEVHVASNGEEEIEYCDKHFNMPFERFPIKKNNIKTYKQLKRIIKDNNYKIVHCHTPVGGVLTRLATKKVRKNGTKVIYTAHGFHFYKGAPLLNWLLYYPIEKYLSKYTDCLITINQEDYEFAKRKLKKANKIELVNGVGVDSKKFNFEMNKQEKNELRKSLGLKEEDFVLIHVAELNKNKNQIMIINAIEKIIKKEPNVKLLLVGNGILREYYENIVKSKKLENNIIFAGYRKDVNKIMKIANVVISTSIREGLPVNLIEAAISKVPIIATNCRGNRDIAVQVVNINDVEELCNKIKDCMNDKEKYIVKETEQYELENIIKNMKLIYEGIDLK